MVLDGIVGWFSMTLDGIVGWFFLWATVRLDRNLIISNSELGWDGYLRVVGGIEHRTVSIVLVIKFVQTQGIIT